MSVRSIRASLLGFLALVALAGLAIPCAQAGEAEADRQLAPLPEGLTSFGAAIVDGALYVYSGHIGEAHAHSADNLSQRFQRLNLRQPGAQWEELPMQTPLQSPSLVAHGNKLYRVGGLSARNPAGEDSDLRSVRELSCYDPATGKWTAGQELPEPRSSHDCAVLGDSLYLIGGWDLGENQDWLSSAWRLSLNKPEASWERLPDAPFERRALATVALRDRVYCIGGMTGDGPSGEVHYFDSASNSWHAGPALPSVGEGHSLAGFGCAACVDGGSLYATTWDGSLWRLSDDGKAWEQAGSLDPGRIFHRMLPVGDGRLVCVGGATREGHLTRVELVQPSKAVTQAEPAASDAAAN